MEGYCAESALNVAAVAGARRLSNNTVCAVGVDCFGGSGDHVVKLDFRSATGCTVIRKHKNNIMFSFLHRGHPHPIDEDNRFEDGVVERK